MPQPTDHEQAPGAQILKKCFDAQKSESFHPSNTRNHCALPFPPEHIIYIFLDEELMCFHSIATLIHSCVCSVCSRGEDRVAKFMYFLFPPFLLLPSFRRCPPSLPYRAFASSGLRDEREQQRPSAPVSSLLPSVSLAS